MKLLFPKTKAALDEFDRTAPDREKLIEKGNGTEWIAAEDAAIQRVQDQFFEDTKDRNTLSGCRSVPISRLRVFAAMTDEEP